MKDKWMNIGYEEDELKPYLEPETDFGDSKRIGEALPARPCGLYATSLAVCPGKVAVAGLSSTPSG